MAQQVNEIHTSTRNRSNNTRLLSHIESREFTTGRNIRLSPLHEVLRSQGACFQQKMNLERPAWFLPPPQAGKGAEHPPQPQPHMEYSFGRQNWFPHHGAEHKAVREAVGIMDQSGFSKFSLKGPSALRLLQRLCGANVDVPIGKTVYTGMFGPRGTFESDLVVIRRAADAFYLVTGSSQGVRDADWITRHIDKAGGDEVLLEDVSDAFAVVGVFGPRSRELLSRVTRHDLSTDAFPFGTYKDISIVPPAGVDIASPHFSVSAVRVTFVGELGWECHVAREHAEVFYKLLMSNGGDLGVENVGHYAINSLRLEKGYRAWGVDISTDDSALEAGLGFAVSWAKPDFIGKEALVRQRQLQRQQGGLPRLLVTFVLRDPEPVLWGSEPIFRNGKAVGYTTSGSYGHTVGAAIGMGYVKNMDGEGDAHAPKGIVTPAWVQAGSFEVLVNGVKYAADAHLRPPYDPDRIKILG